MTDTTGLDFRAGVSIEQLPEGVATAGRAGDDEILVVRRGDDILAVGGHCTHYHGPLADGIVVGDTVRCPWHHACFSLRTGQAVRAPALDPIACWRVERREDIVFVREKIAEIAEPARAPVSASSPRSIVIVGGGAAGFAAAERLRRLGYDGALTMLSADDAPPVDRPNLSKDYLAGTAKEDWIPLKPPAFYAENRIDLQLNTQVTAIDLAGRRVHVAGGATHDFDALLLATGAEPVRLKLAGEPAIPVHYLRTLADSRAIVASAEGHGKRALVIGASFIGLEVAAALRTRDIDVHVVAPDREPLQRVMGTDVGRVIRELHQSKGVVFHMGATVAVLDGRTATLTDGSKIDADFVVAGVGVRPRVALAEAAGLAVDDGVSVDEYLQTSAPGIFAAGDVARWPDPHTRAHVRVEHWVVAQRQGQTAAGNMLGLRERFDAVPYFWSQHYDISINYVGHGDRWDADEVDGSLDGHDATVRFKWYGRTLAVATISRDKESLEAELRMELAAANAARG